MTNAPAGPPPGRCQGIRDESGKEVSDRHLLRRYLTDHDEAAFAMLMARHAGSVWRVCRRVLPGEQDAEDAFQAAFLVLARKAASIRKGEAVGSFLYGVAYRTALKARQLAARRRQREKQLAQDKQERPAWTEAACRELQRLLDEEVQRLPQKYRTAFILCCLEGMSRAEAARELGWKEGTLSGRLAHARQLLQTRLTRRGITLSAVLTAAALEPSTATAAPTVLLQATAKGVLLPLADKAATSLSPSAVQLAQGILRTMTVAQLKGGLAVVLALSTLVTGAGLAAHRLGSGPGQGPPPGPIMVQGEVETFLPRPQPLWPAVDAMVLSLAYSPDGKRLVTAGGRKSGQLRIWDVTTGESLVTVGPVPPTRAVAYSPDGRTLATGQLDGVIVLRDAATGQERATLKGHTGGVNGLAFSPDGRSLASAGLDRAVKLWDVKARRERQTFLGHTDMVFSVAFFHHGQALVSCGQDKSARIWDLQTGKARVTLSGHASGVEGVAVSPDDKLVATASWDRTVRLWDADTGFEKANLPGGTEAMFAVAFSAHGEMLAGATGDGAICLWDAKTGARTGRLQGHEGVIFSLAFSPDGRHLASGSTDTTAKIWDVDAKEQVSWLKTASSIDRPIQALAYAPDGAVVGLGADDGTVQVRVAERGEVLFARKGHADAVTCLAFSPRVQTLASGSADGSLKWWERTTGEEQRTLKGHAGGISALAYSPRGERLASAGDDTMIRLWDGMSGDLVATLKGHDAPVRALAFAPDGRTLASGDANQTIKLWDLTGPKEGVTLRGHHGGVRALAFSPDGLLLASAGAEGRVKLWDAPGGRELRVLEGHTRPVGTLAFSPVSVALVGGSEDGTVWVWDAGTGLLRQTLAGHTAAVTALAFHPRGEHLLSGSTDRTVLRWRPAPTTLPPLTLQAHANGTRFALFSPDGARLASGGAGEVVLWNRALAPAQAPFTKRDGYCGDAAFSADGRTIVAANGTNVQVCDALTGEVRHTLPVGGTVRCVALSPDGTYLAAGTGVWTNQDAPSQTRLFHVLTGQEVARLDGHTGLTYQVRFSPDGKTLATTSKDNTVRLWDVPSGMPRATLRGHARPARGIAFLPDGTLVSAGWDGVLRFWDVETLRERRAWKTTLTVGSLAVSADGTLLAVAEIHWANNKGPSQLEVWEVATGKVKCHLQGHGCRINGMAFTADGRGLLAAGNVGESGEIDYWDLPTGQLRSIRKVRPDAANVAVSRDGRRVLSTSWAGLFLWDLNCLSRERTWQTPSAGLTCGLFDSRGGRLMCGSRDGTIRLWDVADGKCLATLEGHAGATCALALLPDGQTLASAGMDMTVKLWDLTTFREKRTLRGHTRPVCSLAVLSGDVLASGGGDADGAGPGELFLWDARTGRQVNVLAGIDKAVCSLASSPDGSLLAAGITSGVIKVFGAKTGQVQATVSVPRVGPLTFSADGRSLAAGESAGQQVFLLDTATWRRSLGLQRHTDRISSIAFSPDGGALASASLDGTIKLSSLPSGGSRATAVARMGETPIGEPEVMAERAGEPSNEAADAAVEPTTAGTPKRGRKVWLGATAVLGLVLTLTFGLWLYLRQRSLAGDRPS
jgi:RNA polymerase sigma factor (sigma-70 family)